jgi:hypothetical protein
VRSSPCVAVALASAAWATRSLHDSLTACCLLACLLVGWLQLPAPSPRWEAGRLSQQHSLPRQASQQESQLLWRSASARRASADQRQQQEESREQQQRRQSNGSCHL